ncbi:MucBP domain-containing protein [Listeria newyorkensis]|uniref:MucBP domain-containing protein n=1 Tax=Listeria newyorkensis TaxID=1497681 RepID=A0A841YXH5_9LIST|nr:MucBP domain-containing protein [Listeria newyorkensis]MBC1458120.1 hypothetical protein [Listeria newyorkensis]
MTKFSWIKLFLCIVLIGSTIWLPKTAQAEDAPVFPVGKTFEEVMPDVFTRAAFGAEIMQTTEANYAKNESKYGKQIVTQADFDRAITSHVKYEDSINFTFNTEGMQYLRNLEVFRFYSGYTGVDMDDLSYLAPLKKLRELSLGDVSSVTDLSPLRGLTNLEYLFLWSNKGITDLSPLAGLTKLEQLELNKTSVTSIAPLRNLTNLKKLTINGYFDDAWTLKDLPLLQQADTSYTIRTTVTVPSTTVGKATKLELLTILGEPFDRLTFHMDGQRGDSVGQLMNGGIQWNKAGQGIMSYGLEGKTQYQYFNMTINQEVKPQVAGQPVTIHYETETGDVLAAPTVLQGMQEFSYEATAKELEGYTLVETKGNATGVFTDQPQTVRFIYQKVENGHVEVHYVDTEGQTLRTSDAYSGRVGDTYELRWLAIAGYQIKEAPSPTGTYTMEPQTITVVYSQKPAETGVVEVQYIDKQGNILRASDRYEGKIGEAYTLTWPAIPGYDVTKVPATKGSYQAGVTTFQVIYSSQEQVVPPKEIEPEKETPDTKPEKENQGGQVSIEDPVPTALEATILSPNTKLPTANIRKAGNLSVPPTGARLPVTGDAPEDAIPSMLVGIFCVISGVCLWRRRM